MMLKEYLIDKLQAIEAERLGLTVSLEEAKALATESRASLEQAGGEALDFMMKVIEAHGVTPDEYWNNQAVLAY